MSHPTESVRKILGNISWILSRKSLVNLAPIISKLNNPVKELSEALVVFNYIYRITKKWEKWTLVDLCSGKLALLSSITVFNTKNSRAISVDIEEPDPALNTINRLEYLKGSIYEEDTLRRIKEKVEGKVVVAGIHCCKTLAIRTIEIVDELHVDIGYLIPCCDDFPAIRRLGLWNNGSKTYQAWVDALVKYANSKGLYTRVSFEPMLSPKNALITMSKNEGYVTKYTS